MGCQHPSQAKYARRHPEGRVQRAPESARCLPEASCVVRIIGVRECRMFRGSFAEIRERHPEPERVCPLGETGHMKIACERGCSCVGQGAMVRQLRSGCSTPTDCRETHTLVPVVRVTTHAAGSSYLNWHGRGPVHLSCALQPAIKCV